MIKNEEFGMHKIKINEKRLSKPIIETQRNVDLRITTKTKTKTHIKKFKNSLPSINITKQDLFDFFIKASSLRTKQELEIFSNYLCEKYQYFNKIKREDSQLKVENIIKICRLEKKNKGESIINFGEEGDKFYIVLEGTVVVFKPKYEEINILPNDFINLMNRIKEKDGDLLRYNRIKEQNIIFFNTYSEQQQEQNENINNEGKFNSLNFMNRKPNRRSEIDNLKHKQIFIIESEEKLGEYGEGFSFGEIALIKKTTRNATIKAKSNCFLLTIEKKDYNRAILEFEKKKLNKNIEDFIRIYSFFKDFTHDRVIRLFNCFSKKTIYRGEYLYQQNKRDEFIYIINNGTFQISCNISFFWLNDYIQYILYDEKNLLEYLIDNKQIKYTDLVNKIKKCYKKLGNKDLPLHYVNQDLWEKINERSKKDNLYNLKKDEEKLNDPDNIYNIEIKKINYDDILGLEEIFEFKKRFCTCKCLSERADIKYISIYEFLKLIMNLGEDELKYLLNVVNERKKLLKNQIIKAIKNQERKIISEFDNRYENLLKEAECKNTTKEKKNNQIFSTIKMRGYKDNLHDILDNNIPLIKTDKSSINPENKEKNKKIWKSKSSEAIIQNFYLKENKTDNNTVKMKIIKMIKAVNNKRKLLNKRISSLNSATSSTKYYFNKNNFLNENTNFTTFFRKSKKRKVNNFNKNKILNTKSSFEKTISNLNFDESKTINYSPNIFNIKTNSNLIKFKSDTVDNKISKFSNNQFRDAYESINLPGLLKDKNIGRNKNNFKKEINNYNNFYLIYNSDKNFFVSTEFGRQLSTFKNESMLENNKVIK